MLDQKVLITGASGFVGTHLVEGLLRKNICTIGAYLHHRPRSKPNFFTTCADLRNSSFATGTLEGVGTAVHLAWQPLSDQQNSKPHINQEITKKLLRQLEGGKVKRLIYLSAIGASPDSESSFLREKYECERLVLSARIREKIIIRSSIIYSGSVEEDVFLQYVIKQLQIPWFFAVSNTKAKIAPIHAQDISSFLIDIISQKRNIGSNIIEVAGDEEIKVEDIYRQVAKRFVSGNKFVLRGNLFKKIHKALMQSSKTQIKKEDRTIDLMQSYQKPSEEFLVNNPLAEFIPKSAKSFDKALFKVK